MLLHQSLQLLLADAYALVAQLAQDTWSAVAAPGLGLHGPDMHQQCIVAQVTPRRGARLPSEVRVVTTDADPPARGTAR